MWMVGYNEGAEFNMADYGFNGRKLRPLMPRPVTSPNNTSNTNSPYLTRIHHGNDFFSQYHNLGIYALFILPSLFLWLCFHVPVVSMHVKENMCVCIYVHV